MVPASHKENHLNVRLEELDNWKRRLTIDLPEDEVGKKADELFEELAAKAEAPGFRKGKVPRDMLERKYGEQVKIEALESLIPDAYFAAVKETGIAPICDPTVEMGSASPSDGSYQVTVTVEVRPEIELKDYKGLEFTEKVPIVTNEDVEKALEEIREGQADLVGVTRPSVPGDYAIVDFERLDENGEPVPDTKQEGFPAEVGSGRIPQELEEAILGASAGEEKTVPVTYPADYGAEELAGKTITLRLRVTEVKEKRVPPLSDELAKKAGNFATVLDLRVGIRNQLEAEAKAWARRRLEEEIVGKLIEGNPFELPECLITERLDRMHERFAQGRKEEAQGGDGGNGGADDTNRDAFDRVYRPVVEHQLKAGLILGVLSKEHGIEVTRQDIEQRIALIAEQHGREPAELLKDLEGSESLSEIENDIWLGKVHELIVGFSKVTTEPFDVAKAREEAEAQAAEAAAKDDAEKTD
jgi:trigger factor